jgi:hypothetical protein
MVPDDVATQFKEKPYIAFVMVADHAEAFNGKLYINGGGWTDLQRPVISGQAPPPTAFSIALSVYIPWGETNRPIPLKGTVEDEDGKKLFDFSTPLVAGRPPQMSVGQGQYFHAAVQVVMPFPKPGGYRAVVTIDGDRDTRTWAFRIHDVIQQHQKAS